MKKYLIFVFLLVTSKAFTQPTFERWYGGTQVDEGRDLVQVGDSGFVLLGRSWSWTTGGSDIVLIRTNKWGDTLWTKHYGGTENEFTTGSIDITNDGGLIIAANTYSFGTGAPASFNWYVFKTDINGNLIWSKTWGSIGNDELRDISPVSDGGYLLSGSWIVNGFSKGILLKVDSVGNDLWGDTLGSSGNSHFTYAIENDQQEYVTIGNLLAGTFNVVVRKYDAAGNLLINKMYDYGTAEGGVTIETIPSGGYICSATYGFLPSFDPWVLRLDENLDTLFTRELDFQFYVGNNIAKLYSIYPSGNGFIIAGSDSNLLMLRKTDSLLNTEWEQLYGGTMGDMGVELVKTSDNGFAVVGLTYSNGGATGGIYLVKTDSLGFVNNNTGIVTLSEKEFQLFPNPCDDYVIVNLSNSHSEKMIRLMDLQGRIIFHEKTFNSYYQVNTSGLNKGMYLITVTDPNGLNLTRRLLKN